VWYNSLTRRSRPLLVPAEARTNVPDRGQGRGVARFRARQVGSDGLREVAIVQRMPDVAEFCLAFRGMMPTQTLTTGEVFSLLAQSRLSAGQGPTPTSVGIHYGPSERTAAVFFGSNGAGGSRGSGEQMTPTTLVAILSLLQRPAAPSLSRGSGGLSVRHFLQLALSQC
jgi:hypothetical protein